jgi:hypothetical protein
MICHYDDEMVYNGYIFCSWIVIDSLSFWRVLILFMVEADFIWGLLTVN